mmetsp:Transcript_30219/g.29709  ORF Transcript_30219/g.29709 Transcript_30219/m.29709 type:complete len:109 (+) Transcript_30219:136-462(+)
MMMPKPISAVILAFPIKEAHQEMRDKMRDDFKADPDSSVTFIKQKIRMACGTMAILHATLNCSEEMEHKGFLKDLVDFGSKIEDETTAPDELAQFLIDSEELEKVHGE